MWDNIYFVTEVTVTGEHKREILLTGWLSLRVKNLLSEQVAIECHLIFVAPWLMQKTIGTFSANEARAFVGLNKFARIYFGFSVSPCGIFFPVS